MYELLYGAVPFFGRKLHSKRVEKMQKHTRNEWGRCKNTLETSVKKSGKNKNELRNSIENSPVDIQKNEISEEAEDLLKKILEKDKQKRLTCLQALEHEWFRKN